MRLGVRTSRSRRFSVELGGVSGWPMARFGGLGASLMSPAGASAPYRDRVAAVPGIGGELLAEGCGAIAIALVEAV